MSEMSEQFNLREAASQTWAGITAYIDDEPFLIVGYEGEDFLLEGEDGRTARRALLDEIKAGSERDRLLSISRSPNSPLREGSVFRGMELGKLALVGDDWQIKTADSRFIVPFDEMIEILEKDGWKVAAENQTLLWLLQKDGTIVYAPEGGEIHSHDDVIESVYGEDPAMLDMYSSATPYVAMGKVRDGEIHIGSLLPNRASNPSRGELVSTARQARSALKAQGIEVPMTFTAMMMREGRIVDERFPMYWIADPNVKNSRLRVTFRPDEGDEVELTQVAYENGIYLCEGNDGKTYEVWADGTVYDEASGEMIGELPFSPEDPEAHGYDPDREMDHGEPYEDTEERESKRIPYTPDELEPVRIQVTGSILRGPKGELYRIDQWGQITASTENGEYEPLYKADVSDQFLPANLVLKFGAIGDADPLLPVRLATTARTATASRETVFGGRKMLHGDTYTALERMGFPKGSVTVTLPTGQSAAIPPATADAASFEVRPLLKAARELATDYGSIANIPITVTAADEEKVQLAIDLIHQFAASDLGLSQEHDARVAISDGPEKERIRCPKCSSNSVRATLLKRGEMSDFHCLTCGADFQAKAGSTWQRPEDHIVALAYDILRGTGPQYPEERKEEVLALMREITAAAERGDRAEVMRLQAEFEKLMGVGRMSALDSLPYADRLPPETVVDLARSALTERKDPADPFTSVEDHFGSMQKEAPGKKHLPYATPKRNRQYEHILESCQKEHPNWSKDRCKELAARTVNKQRSEKGETKSRWQREADRQFVDSAGNPIEKGRAYRMHSTKYTVPDLVEVEEVGDKLTARIKSGEKNVHPIEIDFDSIEQNGYSFEPFVSVFKLRNTATGSVILAKVDDLGELVAWARADDPEYWITADLAELEQMVSEGRYVPLQSGSTKTAARSMLSSEEQQALINESPDALARNFQKLDLNGTHYTVWELIGRDDVLYLP